MADSISNNFDFNKAFSRNIGWVTENELNILRQKRIAIAGLGGVGGHYLLSLARLGIGRFNIADIDIFEIENFNRQIGATTKTINLEKITVLNQMAKEINPELEIKTFSRGVDLSNIDEFLSEADLYLDGLDFFALDSRLLIFRRCYELGIPAITAAPLGMGVSCLIFMPGKMSFDDYFCLKNCKYEDQIIYFLIGLNPTLSNRHYLFEKSAVNFNQQRVPSTITGCLLCAGVVATEALKILLKRGKIYYAPHYQLYDAYLYKHRIGWLPWGNKNPMQKLKYYFVKRLLR